MDDVEFYLASVWKYQAAGVDRVLDALRKKHPGGHYVYEADEGWFRVRCRAGDVPAVQASFREVHTVLEQSQPMPPAGGSGSNSGSGNSPWLSVPSPSELTHESVAPVKTTTAAAAAAPVVADHLCPLAFERFACNKVWARVKTETPASITVQSFLGDDDRRAIVLALAGAVHLEVDPTGRLVFVGGRAPDVVARACEMLDNLFRKFVYVVPPPKHLVWAEADGGGPCQVDARFMAHVHDGMLTSSIFDPGQYPPGACLDELFSAVFAKAACLRICFCDQVRRIEVSYFGPRAPPIFHDQARTWPVWFKRAEYTPKASGGAHGKQKNQQEPSQALVRVSREIDLLADDVPFIGEAALQPTSLAVRRYSAPVLDVGACKHGGELRLLQQFLVDPYKGSTGGQGVDSAEAAEDGEEALISFDDDETPPQALALGYASHQDDQTRNDHDNGNGNDNDNLLIDVPPPPPVTRPASPRTTMAALYTNNSRALVRRTTFTNSLCSQVGRLMGDLPYCRGRIRVQVELGRIYIMDTAAEGLAKNRPGEPASGWPHTEIISRLDTVCVAPDSVVFTKALTLFANDMESILGLPPGGGEGELVDVDMKNSDSNSEWAFHDKRIVYELKCERRVVDGATGVVTVQSPFVVEIDGTMPGAFAYSLRRVDDSRPPVWVHCIRRSWDARVVVSYSATDALEAAYGGFARELVQSMVVPPGPMTRPRFQVAYHSQQPGGGAAGSTAVFTKVQSARVRNVGRFVSSDGAAFLDVSWVRHMVVVEDSDDNDRKKRLRFAGLEDRQAQGVFGTWYEASVVSAAAEQALRENETLAVGARAGWGRDGAAAMDAMTAAAIGPALRLVQRMDGVGVLIDNGQGNGKRWMPGMRTGRAGGSFW